MPIWEYVDPIAEESLVRSAMDQSRCPFCDSELERTEDEAGDLILRDKVGSGWDSYSPRVQTCPACGWWRIAIDVESNRSYGGKAFVFSDGLLGATARLRSFDTADLSTPLEEVSAYLTANFEARFGVHPRKFEEVVGSVFRNLGFEARVTAFTGDGGVDVVLDGGTDTVVGVQVKRYRNKIKAEAIRALTGALVVNGYTEGIFVTTSSFEPGCSKTAELASIRGYPIRLMDAERFYGALKLSQRASAGGGAADLALYEAAELVLLEYEDIPCSP